MYRRSIFIKILSLMILLTFDIGLLADTITLESPLRPHDVLKGSQVYIDKQSDRSVSELLRDPALFHRFEADKVDLGYTVDGLWVLFSVQNRSSDTLYPVLEIDNPILDHLDLYRVEGARPVEKMIKGVQLPLDFHGPVHFNFDLRSAPNSDTHYLLHASSVTSALYFRATVMSKNDFFFKELRHQLILTLFFGLMIGLIIYNLFIYFYTKETAYLFYVGYQLFVILAYASYTKMVDHILGPLMIESDAYLGVFYLMGNILFMLLFTRSFLGLKKYPWIDLGLKTIASLALLNLLFSYTCCYMMEVSTSLILLSSLYLIGISVYLSFRREPHASYFVIGWSVSLIGLVFLALTQIGLTSELDHLPYLYEAGVTFEALLFSVMLAQRLNHVKALNKALNAQKVLVHDQYHRVRENMRFIISLYRLRFSDIENLAIRRRLQENENNILAIVAVHEMLYAQVTSDRLDTQEYFQRLIDAILDAHDINSIPDININLKSTVSLSPDHSIYCGIILNELVTNSVKYAFDGISDARIEIALYQENDEIHFVIADNGTGYVPEESSEGFGLMMLQALVTGELRGAVEVEHDRGTRYHIVWTLNDKR